MTKTDDTLTPAERLKLVEEALERAIQDTEGPCTCDQRGGYAECAYCDAFVGLVRALEALRGMEVTPTVERAVPGLRDHDRPAVLLTLKGEDDGSQT